jgi:hypothetical protein
MANVPISLTSGRALNLVDFKVTVGGLAGLNRFSPTRYEFSHKDFHPERELDLLILQKNQ